MVQSTNFRSTLPMSWVTQHCTWQPSGAMVSRSNKQKELKGTLGEEASQDALTGVVQKIDPQQFFSPSQVLLTGMVQKIDSQQFFSPSQPLLTGTMEKK